MFSCGNTSLKLQGKAVGENHESHNMSTLTFQSSASEQRSSCFLIGRLKMARETRASPLESETIERLGKSGDRGVLCALGPTASIATHNRAGCCLESFSLRFTDHSIHITEPPLPSSRHRALELQGGPEKQPRALAANSERSTPTMYQAQSTQAVFSILSCLKHGQRDRKSVV